MPDRPTPAAPNSLALDEREVRADETELELSLLEAQLRGRERQLQATRQALVQRGDSVDLREKSLQHWAVQAGEPGMRLVSQLGTNGASLAQADDDGVLPRIFALHAGREAVLEHREAWLQTRREHLQRRQEELTACERSVPRLEMTLAMRERRLTQTSARLERMLSDPSAALALPELPGAALRRTASLPESAARERTASQTTTSTRRLTGMPVFRPAEAPAGAMDASGRAGISGSAAAEPIATEIDLNATPQARVLVDHQSWVDPRHAETWTIPRPGNDGDPRPVVTRRKTTPISSDVWSKLLESSGGPRRKSRRSGALASSAIRSSGRISGGDDYQFVRLEGVEIPRSRIEFDRPTQVMLISVAGDRPLLADKATMAWEDRGEWVELPLQVRRVMPEGQQTWVVVAAAEGWSELDLDRWEAALGKS